MVNNSPQQLENSSRSGIRSGSDRERGYLGDSSGRRTGTRTGSMLSTKSSFVVVRNLDGDRLAKFPTDYIPYF